MAGLYSVVLKLKSVNEAVISPTQGYYAFALFLNLIRGSNPELAEELHRSTSMKAFTLSPLLGKFQKIDKNLKLIANGEYSFRLTFLSEEIFCHFMDAVLKSAKQVLRLESALFNIDSVLVNRTESPLCNFQQFEELAENGSKERKIHLQFDSVTTFRSGGKRNIIFPEPSLILGSYYNKWQHFSPLKFPKTLNVCWENVRLSRYKLETHIQHFNGYQETGFAGKCTLELETELPEETVKAINTLADFSFYCGTGAKTTMGMGQTRRIYER
jgi:CRISPR-associated endoribonuclease Cas6